MNKIRIALSALSLSAVGFMSILGYEGYSSEAYQPVAGDVWTIGFGTTTGVKEGDVIDPLEALERARSDTDKVEDAIKRCVKVPLSPGEYDAYSSLTYNIGVTAFCTSTLVKKLNQGDYQGACNELHRWVYFKGKKLPGLVNRRAQEYATCIGK